VTAHCHRRVKWEGRGKKRKRNGHDLAAKLSDPVMDGKKKNQPSLGRGEQTKKGDVGDSQNHAYNSAVSSEKGREKKRGGSAAILLNSQNKKAT